MLLASIVVLYLVGLIALANRLDRVRMKTEHEREAALAYPYGMADAPSAPPAPPPQAESDQTNLRRLLTLMLVGVIAVVALNGVSVLLSVVMPAEALPDDSLAGLSLTRALLIALIGGGASAFSGVLLFSEAFRRWIDRGLGQQATFDPGSSVHLTASVLAVSIFAYTIMDVILVGGVSGLAESLETQQLGVFDAVLTLIVMPAAALLGVGVLVRRSWRGAVERLDLRLPTREDWTWGFGTAFACLIMVVVFSLLLTLFLPQDVIQQQGAASEQIARAFGGSLTLAFLASASAAVGEEILFRGALQPVFGLIPTTLFFGLLHAQYALTPASLAILLVGGALGVLKNRQSTTAAIIAHFAYNFVQLGLVYLAIQLEEAGLMPETMESIIRVPLAMIVNL